MAKRNWDKDPPNGADELSQMINETLGGDFAVMSDNMKLHRPMIALEGLWGLNWVLAGGLRLGRSFQLYGPEGAGKSYLTLKALAAHQKYAEFKGEDRMVGYLDYERTWDYNFAKKCGLDTDPERLMIINPPTGDKGFDAIHIMVMQNKFNALGIDSVAAMIPKHDLHRALEDKTMGTLAKMMSDGLRKVTGSMDDCSLIWINQIREKLGVMFGSPLTTPGGKALNFYSSVSIEVKKGSVNKMDLPVMVDGKEETQKVSISHTINAVITKNKTGGSNGNTVSMNFSYPQNPWAWGVTEQEELWGLGFDLCHVCHKRYLDHVHGDADHDFQAYINKDSRTYWSDPLGFKTAKDAFGEFRTSEEKISILREGVRTSINQRASDLGLDVFWPDTMEMHDASTSVGV